MRHKPVKSPWLVPFDGSFKVKHAATSPPSGTPKKKELEGRLAEQVERLGDLQRVLYAHDCHAILLVFQAMDAAGKDGTIRAVLTGVDPAGCQVTSFKAPSAEEIDHDFLWRCAKALPERGRIGVFNRSWYEEVLTVRVHPEYVTRQRLPHVDLENIWQERLESIRHFERHLRRNGTIVLKFWLNVSREEQKKRFMERLEDPKKLWKFDSGDVSERQRWPAYMDAYQAVFEETSREEAPWYAIPADDKAFMRVAIAEIIVETLEGLDLNYPELDGAERARRSAYRDMLLNEP